MDEKLWDEIDEREPIPAHIYAKMEELRHRRQDVPEDRLIDRLIELVEADGE